MSDYNNMDLARENTQQKLRYFLPLVGLSQVLGLTAVIMVIVWMGLYYNGFSWATPDTVFNYHPVFMVLGLVFCYGDAILSYRVFRSFPKLPIKILHAVMNILALFFCIVGLKAVFDMHSAKMIPNMYSLHSWVGMGVVVFFALQWMIGLVTFLVPSIPQRLRARVLPIHTSMGLLLFVGAITACITGITEKNFFTKQYSDMPATVIVGNVLGVVIVLFGGLVVYLVNREDYKRTDAPAPEQTGLTNTTVQ